MGGRKGRGVCIETDFLCLKVFGFTKGLRDNNIHKCDYISNFKLKYFLNLYKILSPLKVTY